MVKVCKDCVAERGTVAPPLRPRPLVEGSGGRCATHWRKEKARRKAAAHGKRVRDVYGLPDGAYDRLYEFQGRRCAICQRATGVSRKLAVDHDHKTGIARGLLCSPCNKLLGHLRDSVDIAQRVIDYLDVPPAALLGIVALHEDFRKEDGG